MSDSHTAAGAAIPRQAAVWDERRNTSAIRPPSPTAYRDCMTALASLRRTEPELVKWIEEGHPLLTETEHVQRFGVSWEEHRRRSASRRRA